MPIYRYCRNCRQTLYKQDLRKRTCPVCSSPLIYRVCVSHASKRRSKVVATLAEAKRLEAELRISLEEGLDPKIARRQTMTFSQFVERHYLPHRRTERPKSVNAEVSYFRNWLLPTLGSLPLGKISPFHVERLKYALTKAGKSPRTVEHVLAILRKCLNQARLWGFLPKDYENPVSQVSLPKYDNRRLRFLSPDEASALLNYLQNKNFQLYGIALVALFTGLRRKEILSLTWADLEHHSGTLRVGNPKNSQVRFVPLAQTVKDYFCALYERKKPKSPNEPIFDLSPDYVTHAVSKAMNRLGFNQGVQDPRLRATFHTLPHFRLLAFYGVP